MEKDPLLRREIYEKAKRFEERVAELFRLQGFRTIVDYQKDAMQFDVRLEMMTGALPIFALVECKDTGQTVTQKQVRDFASKVETARDAEKLPYQPILIARSGFANNAYAAPRLNSSAFSPTSNSSCPLWTSAPTSKRPSKPSRGPRSNASMSSRTQSSKPVFDRASNSCPGSSRRLSTNGWAGLEALS